MDIIVDIIEILSVMVGVSALLAIIVLYLILGVEKKSEDKLNNIYKDKIH